jgi:hypothetical protein
MVDLVELQAVAYIAQIVGVVGTLTAAFIAVRSYINANKRAEEGRRREIETRQAQLFVQLYSQYYNKDWVAASYETADMKYRNYEEFWEKYGGVEWVKKWDLLSHYFEGAGILVKKGLVDPSLVTDLFSEEFVTYWEMISPFVREYRVRANKPKTCENQEYLYNLVKKAGK